MNAWEGMAAHPALPAGTLMLPEMTVLRDEKRVTGVFLPVTIHQIAPICE